MSYPRMVTSTASLVLLVNLAHASPVAMLSVAPTVPTFQAVWLQAMSTSDRTDLMKTAETSNSFLLGRMDTAFADIDNATNAIAENQKQKLAQLQHAVLHVATGVKAFGDLDESSYKTSGQQWNINALTEDIEACKIEMQLQVRMLFAESLRRCRR